MVRISFWSPSRSVANECRSECLSEWMPAAMSNGKRSLLGAIARFTGGTSSEAGAFSWLRLREGSLRLAPLRGPDSRGDSISLTTFCL
jgi:hypothetical protein